MYSDAFNEQMRICTYVSAVALLAALSTYQKNPPSVAAMREKQTAVADESSDESTELRSIVGTGPAQPDNDSQKRRQGSEQSLDLKRRFVVNTCG